MTNKINISKRKKGKSVGGSKSKMGDIEYVTRQTGDVLMFGPDLIESIYKQSSEPLVGRMKKILKRKKQNPSKKHGGKITYKMTGGQVVDSGYE